MKTPLLIAIIFCSFVSLLGFIFMLWQANKSTGDKKYVFSIWGIGFLLFLFSYFAEIFIVVKYPHIRPIREIVKVSGGLLFMWGTLLIVGRTPFEKYIFPAMFLIITLPHLYLGKNPYIVSSIFSSISFLVVAYFFFLLFEDIKSVSSAILSVYFLLGGIHYADYFLLRPIEWYAPYGFSLFGIFLSIILFGFWKISEKGGLEIESKCEWKCFYASTFFGITILFFIIINPFLPYSTSVKMYLGGVGVALSVLPLLIILKSGRKSRSINNG